MEDTNGSTLRDNRLVDVFSALVVGIGIWLLEFLNTPQFLRPAFRQALFAASFKAVPFVLVAVLLSMWNNRWRTRWAWLAIATIGILASAGIDEWVYRQTTTDPDFFAGLSPFPMEIVLFLLPALVFMAVAQYLGVFIQRRLRTFD
jgi:hypothetical protein